MSHRKVALSPPPPPPEDNQTHTDERTSELPTMTRKKQTRKPTKQNRPADIKASKATISPKRKRGKAAIAQCTTDDGNISTAADFDDPPAPPPILSHNQQPCCKGEAQAALPVSYEDALSADDDATESLETALPNKFLGAVARNTNVLMLLWLVRMQG
jgi:hypothetical protein